MIVIDVNTPVSVATAELPIITAIADASSLIASVNASEYIVEVPGTQSTMLSFLSDYIKLISEAIVFTDTFSTATPLGTSDSFGVVEIFKASLSKVLVESLNWNENTIFQTNKLNVDTIATADKVTFNLTKLITDTISFIDTFQGINGLNASKTDTFGMVEALTTAFGKNYPESFALNESLLNSVGKTTKETFALNSSATMITGKVIKDTITTSESGSTFLNNYAASTYFAGQYVGSISTF